MTITIIIVMAIELVKSNGKPVTYEEDDIKYEFFGADP